jgi:hypothetical protein
MILIRMRLIRTEGWTVLIWAEAHTTTYIFMKAIPPTLRRISVMRLHGKYTTTSNTEFWAFRTVKHIRFITGNKPAFSFPSFFAQKAPNKLIIKRFYSNRGKKGFSLKFFG